MTNAREELEQIFKIYGNDCSNGVICKIVQTILDAGFIRLEDVEMDKEKLAITLYKGHAGEEYYKKAPWQKLPLRAKRSWLKSATAIASAKGIIKRKEGK